MDLKKIIIYLKAHRAISIALKKLFDYSIGNKQTIFNQADFPEEYKLLLAHECINKYQENMFLINYEHFYVTSVLLNYAQAELKEKIGNNITDGLAFADRFSIGLRQPNPSNYWNSALDANLTAYVLIYLNQIKRVDITAFLYLVTQQVKDENKALITFESDYCHAYPYLNDDTKKAYYAIIHLMDSTNYGDSARHALQTTGERNPEKGWKLYKYGKKNNAIIIHDFFSKLLIGLFNHEPEKCLQEAITLFSDDKNAAITAFTRFNYGTTEQVEKMFSFVEGQQIVEMEILIEMPAFYCTIIENAITPEHIRKKCFNELSWLTKQTDERFRHQLLWRVQMVKGFDDDREVLLNDFLQWQSPAVLKGYFDYFSSPVPLFSFIKQVYLSNGIAIDIGLFTEGLQAQYMSNKIIFEKALLEMLSDPISMVRYAGIRIFNSAYGGQVYPVDFLSLDEQRQLRVIDTLLPMPWNIEHLVPLIINLRKSSFKNVKTKLTAQLTELIHAYDQEIINMVKTQLEPADKADKKLLNTLEKAYAVYATEKKLKNTIGEFNPVNNEATMMELFFRLEREDQAEKMEKAQEQDVFTRLARTINIIRGNGWKMEIKPEISLLQTYKSSILMDQRMSINPEKFEWQYRMNATSKK